jgi:hypothetical protein
MYQKRYFLDQTRYVMAEKTDWEARAANLLKAELKRQGVTYAQLVDRLAAIGVEEKEANIRNKLSRGKFSAAFLLACLESIGAVEVKI